MPIEACPEELSTNDETEDLPGELTAGDVLLQERLRRGLTEKQVADKLHITMHYIKAMESNNYEKLPAGIFARGYIKSYALLLGLEADDLLNRYNEFNTQQQDVIAKASRLKARRKKDKSKLIVIISLLVFIAGFIVLWLANSYFSGDTIAETSVSTGTETNKTNSLSPTLSQEAQQTVAQSQLSLHTEPEEISASTTELVVADAAFTSMSLNGNEKPVREYSIDNFARLTVGL